MGEIKLTDEQLILLLKNELHLGSIVSIYEPNGVFSSIEEKQTILEYLYEKNNVSNQRPTSD